MKTFIICFETKRSIEIISKVIEKCNLDVQYVLTHNVCPKETLDAFKNQNIDDVYDLFQKKQYSKFVNNDEENKEIFKATQIWDKHFNNLINTFQRNNIEYLDYFAARRYILKMLCIVQALFTKYDPKLVIFTATPHEFFEYIFFVVAKFNNIKTIYGFLTFFPLMEILTDEPNIEDIDIFKNCEENKSYQSSYIDDYIEIITNQKCGKENNEIRLANHWRLLPNKNNINYCIVYSYLTIILWFFCKIKLIQKLFVVSLKLANRVMQKLSLNILLIRYFYETLAILNPNKYYLLDFISSIKNMHLAKKYYKLTKDFNINNLKNSRYIFVPMAYQPECTTVPIGGEHYWDYFTIIKTLAAYLPSDVKIFVKEHPHQFQIWNTLAMSRANRYRDNKYYDDLLKISDRIVLLPHELPSKDIIDNSLALAIATGTAGFEALINNKNVLVFGHPYYKNIEGIFYIRSEKDLKDGIDKILDPNYRNNIDIEKLKQDILLVAQHSMLIDDSGRETCLNLDGKSLPQISIDFNIELYCDKLSSFLKKL